MPVAKLERQLKRPILNFERIIHSFKTLIACMIGFFLARLFHLQPGQWVIITILVVMCAQVSVGSMLQKSYMRFLGTVTGSIIALITLKFFGNEPLITAAVIGVSALFFSYLATSGKSYSDSGTLGAVTVAIILVGFNPTISTGIERVIEIFLGLIVATLISQFFLPIHARKHLRKNQSSTLKLLGLFYHKLIIENRKQEAAEIITLDENIVKTLIEQRKSATEARREPFGPQFNIDSFNYSLWCEKEILRSIIFMQHAQEKSTFLQNSIAIESVKKFHFKIAETLQLMSVCLDKLTPIPDTAPNMEQLVEALQKDPLLELNQEKIYLDTYLFSAENLIKHLHELMDVINKEIENHNIKK